MDSFDLTTQKWIPCITLTRTYECYSLREVFAQAHTLREVHGDTPLVTVALYRFLLAVLHSVPHYKVKSPEEWLTLWQLQQFDINTITAYLDQWQQKKRFDLFHEQYPFYQDRETASGKEFSKRITEVMHEIASGNNAAWFDHTIETEDSGKDCATAARVVLAAQSFGLTGRDSSGGYQSFGPLVNDVVFVVQGDNLFETLMLNLYLYRHGDPLPERDDRPIWEHDTPLEPRRGLGQTKDAKGKHHPAGYLDLLTWPSRRILLKRDEDGLVRWLKMDQGWVLHPNEASEDPMKAYKKNDSAKNKSSKKFDIPPKTALGWDESRALWRDSTALFRLRTEYARAESKAEFHAPLIIRNLRNLQRSSNGALPNSKVYHCAAFGLCADKASIQFFRAESMPLPLALLADENKVLVEKLDDLLRIAKQAGARLVQAVRAMADWFLQPNEESRKNDKTAAAAQDVLTDLESLRAALDESQRFEKEKKQTERDEKFPQRRGMRTNAELRYWVAVGERFYQAMLALAEKSPTDNEGLSILVADWRRNVWHIAYQAYEEASNALGDSSRALKAYAIGSEILAGRYPNANQSNLKKEEIHEPTQPSKRGARGAQSRSTRSHSVSRKTAR
jgi:CRISPR system Cascade subunit CasA